VSGPVEGRGLAPLVEERSIIVCGGSGGVGKTTVSAAFGVEGARRGRRTCVVTIDPARRLADALGLEGLGNTPRRVEGPWPGELSALMLDPKGTFDDLVRRYAESPEQAAGILSNRLYRNLSSALSGTQEYMAMEKLYELAESGDFELVVVDTPPTRNALDFLDAPRRLTRFLGHRLFQVLLMPTRAYLRAVSVATQALLRTISKVAGAEIVQDAVTFFQAFEGMEEGFRTRADHVRRLLARRSTAFVLVTSPRQDAVDEAGWFADKLNESGLAVEGLVMNRVHPTFATRGALPEAPEGSDLAVQVANLRDQQSVNAREEATMARIVTEVAPSPVVRVPLLDVDVHDVDGLSTVADHVFGPAATVVDAGGPELA
jgi:anion-transporting  ArsA/GET3 family ATPase